MQIHKDVMIKLCWLMKSWAWKYNADAAFTKTTQYVWPKVKDQRPENLKQDLILMAKISASQWAKPAGITGHRLLANADSQSYIMDPDLMHMCGIVQWHTSFFSFFYSW